MIPIAVATLMSHVHIAMQYEHDFNNLWFGISQGPFQGWQDETEPPTPPIIPTGDDPTGKGLTNLMGVKHVNNVSLVVPIENNDQDTGGLTPPAPTASAINYKGQQWQPISDKDAMKYGARWLYLRTNIRPEDLPYGIFRQTGIYYGLQPKAEFADGNTQQITDQAYPASELQPNKGYLISYDDQLMQGYYSNTNLVENVVCEF